MSLAEDQTEQGEELIELLVQTDTVRAWRVGLDYDIECKQDWSDEDFTYVLLSLGLMGRTDFDWSYVPETGMEIFRLPFMGGIVPRQGPSLGWIGRNALALGAGQITAGLIGAGGGLYKLLELWIPLS